MLRQIARKTWNTARWVEMGRKDSAVGRRLFNAATSREKRALNQTQVGGDGASKPPAGYPPSGPPVAGGGGGGSSTVPLIIGGLAVVGGGIAYSQGLIPGISPHPEEVEEQKEEARASKDAPKQATPASTLPADEEAASGNRVIQIALPLGSKRSAPPASSAGHPVGGNKVEMHPSAAVYPSENTPTVDSALKELHSQLSEETSRALTEAHKELAKLSSLDISEMDELSPTQLKIRLVQLSKDLEERTKWEAVRLKEFLAMKEKEVEDK